MPITVTFLLDSLPLKRTFIEHQGMFITDENGAVTLPGSPAPAFKVKVHCQNPVVRILDGANANQEVTTEISLRRDATVNLDAVLGPSSIPTQQFRILQQALNTYDLVWRQFSPFSTPSRSDFPFRRGRSVEDSYRLLPRIELSFPDNFPIDGLAFNEPKSVSTGFPLIHIKVKTPR